MNVIRIYVPDLGENVFKSLGATDTTTIKEVKANLVNKLVGLDTINAVDVTKFSLFEVKDTKEERLDDSKSIMAIIKKWPKKGETPKLVFKSTDSKAKLQERTREIVPDITISVLLDDDDAPMVPVTIPIISSTPTSPSHAHPSSSSPSLQHMPSMPPQRLHSTKDSSITTHSSGGMTNSKNTNETNNLSHSSADQALLMLDDFEKRWKSGGILSSRDVLQALGG